LEQEEMKVTGAPSDSRPDLPRNGSGASAGASDHMFLQGFKVHGAVFFSIAVCEIYASIRLV
jgi:hypothetical protein